MLNPFEFGRELNADELVDRTEELAEILTTMRQAGKLFLIGPRRFGKTSLLKAASDLAQSEFEGLVFRYNVEAFPTLDALVNRLVTDAARALQGGLERSASKVKDYFARLRPEFSVNTTQTEWAIKVGAGLLTENPNRQVTLLNEALDGLERLALAEAGARPVTVILDEFQKIVERGGRESEGQLRASIQQHRRVGYLFAGSHTRLLTEMTTDARRPFYRLGLSRFLGPIPRPEFRRFLAAKFAGGGFLGSGTGQQQFLPETTALQDPLDLLLDYAVDVPYNVQALAHSCWEELSGAMTPAQRLLTPQVITQALRRLVRRYDPMFTQQWNQLTVIQQKTLIALLAVDGRQMQSRAVTNQVGRGAATVRKSLESLMARGIVREEQQLGSIRYCLEDPFFGHWVNELGPWPG